MSADRMDDPPARKPPWKIEWSPHLGLMASAVIGVVVVTRIFSAAQWDYLTAMGILQGAGTASVIFGATMSVVRGVVPIILLLIIALLPYRWRYTKQFPGGSLFLGAFVCIGVLVLTSPVYYLSGIVIVVIGAIFFAQIDRRQTPAEAIAQNRRFVVASIFPLLVVIGALNEDPWLPREVLVLRPEEDRIVGYVLRDTQDMWYILTNSPREVIHIKANLIKDRWICGSNPSWLADRLPSLEDGAAARYPPC